MKSIFEQTTEFFSLKPKTNPVDLELFITNAQTRSLFRISLPYLFQLNSKLEVGRTVDLSTQIFEPFSECASDKMQFGFTLNSEEYFVDTEDDLQNFCKLVENTCILTSIESEFVFIKKIGSGSTSKVYLVQDLDRSRQFAVKCIKKSSLQSSQCIQSLKTEIQILRQLDHPHITKLRFVYEDKEKVYLFFDYLSESNLFAVLSKKGKFEEVQCKAFLRKLLQTLDFLHSQNIVHRDIKLENILITNEEKLEFKLIDFGLAFISKELQTRKCGSPGYIAPEILRDEKYGLKVDIFSAGVVFFTMLHGYLPFDGSNIKNILSNNAKGSVKIDKKLSKTVKNLLIDMMQPWPAQRPSAHELLLCRWLSGKKESLRSICSTISQ